MAEVLIEIREFSFNNDQPTVIAVGDSVRWVNKDGAPHNAVRAEEPTFATALLSTNQTSDPITFSQASDANGLEYVCTLHTFMKGRIIVMLPGSHAAFLSQADAVKMHDSPKMGRQKHS